MTKQLTGKRGDTPLHSASRAGKIAEIKEIFSRTNDEDLKKLLIEQNQSGEIALYVAAEYCYVDVVVEMLKYYDIVSASLFGTCAEVLKALQKAVPELSMTVDLSNTTALHTAATQGYNEVVNFLLALNGSLTKIAKNTGKTALHSAARNGHFDVVKSILVKDQSTATQTDKKGQTALHMAAKGQNIELVEC
ncbi:Ankyrin repeat-containing protein [Thalictrum thalictroides]|uniref:Ankyrin repeat-containing protein n=1 Tax=Thalictrum thalictroides TaxID=46969 RepID=A0A7J6VBI1_THATH|nr:Ankyrin repeat-containing protein [Thalictrum thalictroides]